MTAGPGLHSLSVSIFDQAAEAALADYRQPRTLTWDEVAALVAGDEEAWEKL